MQSWNLFPGGWNTLLHHGSALEVVVYLFKTFNVGHTQKITGIIHTCGALFTCSTDKTVKVLEPNFNPGLISNLSDITAEVAEVRLYSISIHYSTYIEYLAIHLTHNNFSIYECCDKWSHCLSLSLHIFLSEESNHISLSECSMRPVFPRRILQVQHHIC